MVPWAPPASNTRSGTSPARSAEPSPSMAGRSPSPRESFAVLDRGRGRWPYSKKWNWGAGSGFSGGKRWTAGRGKWTDGTGSTENALVVDGRLSYWPDELRWRYDLSDPSSLWQVQGNRSRRPDPFPRTRRRHERRPWWRPRCDRPSGPGAGGGRGLRWCGALTRRLARVGGGSQQPLVTSAALNSGPRDLQPRSCCPRYVPGWNPGGMANTADPTARIHVLSRSCSASRCWIGTNWRSGSAQ